MEERKAIAKLLTVILVAANVFVWYAVFIGRPTGQTKAHFLDVGQGDSVFLELKNGVDVLVDAGPGRAVREGLAKRSGAHDGYIDLAVATHNQTDHFEGLFDILTRYRVGALLVNGRAGEEGSRWAELLAFAEEKEVPVVRVGAGDAIRHHDQVFHVLHHDALFLGSGEPNETSIVLFADTGNMRTLLTGDIGVREEEYLLERYPELLSRGVDVLKVAHHGSKYSSGPELLNVVRPTLAIIQSGRNSYGHPTQEVIDRLGSVGAHVFRNDQHGTISVFKDEGELRVVGGDDYVVGVVIVVVVVNVCSREPENPPRHSEQSEESCEITTRSFGKASG